MYNLIEYSDDYSKTLQSLWQCYRGEPVLTDSGVLNSFPGNSAWFNYKQKITGSKGDGGIKAVKTMVPLKFWSSFQRTLEMPFINCEIKLILTWSKSCVISNAAASQDTTFAITDTKLYVTVLTLTTQDNANLFLTINIRVQYKIDCNKYQSKTTSQQYLILLIIEKDTRDIIFQLQK